MRARFLLSKKVTGKEKVANRINPVVLDSSEISIWTYSQKRKKSVYVYTQINRCRNQYSCVCMHELVHVHIIPYSIHWWGLYPIKMGTTSTEILVSKYDPPNERNQGSLQESMIPGLGQRTLGHLLGLEKKDALPNQSISLSYAYRVSLKEHPWPKKK